MGHNVEISKTPLLHVTISPVVQHANDPAGLHEPPVTTPVGVAAAVPVDVSVVVELCLRAKTVLRKANTMDLMMTCIVLRKSELNDVEGSDLSKINDSLLGFIQLLKH
jgi:hypothetical protein